MHIIRYISLCLAAVLVSSCMAVDGLWDAGMSPLPEDGAMHFVVGKVVDVDDNEIEHIKVTIDWEAGGGQSVNYTASDGTFAAEVPMKTGGAETVEFKITFEDIDGEKNGGLFKTLSDKGIYSLDPENPGGIIIYRLNRATASENSPQS